MKRGIAKQTLLYLILIAIFFILIITLINKYFLSPGGILG